MESLHVRHDDDDLGDDRALVDVLLQRGPDLESYDSARRAINYCHDGDNGVAIAVIVLDDGRTVTYDSARPGRRATVTGVSADGTCWSFHAGPGGPELPGADDPDLARHTGA